MKPIAFSISLIFISLNCIFSQELKQTIKGRIIDSETESPLVGATVIVLSANPILGGNTDFDGNFKISNVSIGRHNIRVSMIGYEELNIPNIEVGSGKEIVLNFRLRETLVNMKAVEITGDKSNKSEALNDMATVSARAFTVEETKRYAGALNDPGRMALSFAGVAANNDLSNEIVVRGNSPRGLLWRMEGVEIPNPNHFSNTGSSGGAISMLNVNMMANSDFFTGAFPAEFGNAMGGVFDIRLRKGNNEKRETALQIGVIGTDMALEGPIKKGYSGSYLINYRYSSLALLQRAGLDIVGDAVPTFQDISFNISLPTRHIGQFTLFGIGGISEIDQQYEAPDNLIRSKYKTTLGVGGLTHAYHFGDKALVKTVMAFTETTSRYLEKELDTTEVYRRDLMNEQFKNTAFRMSSYLNYKINASNSLRVGLIYSLLGFDMNAYYFNRDLSLMEKLIEGNGSAPTFQSYVNWKNRVTDQISINAGAHFIQSKLNGHFNIEPRAGIRWAVDSKQTFSAGVGLHSRLEDPSFYLFQRLNEQGNYVQLNRNLDFSKAFHSVIGYERQLATHLNLKTELYYQSLFNIPVAKNESNSLSAINMSEGFAGIEAINEGSGHNVGIDFTLEKFFEKQYFFLLTTSLFDSKYKGSDGVVRNTTFNSRFAGNFLIGKEFGLGRENRNKLLISLRMVAAGGRYFTPVLLEESKEAGRGVYDDERAYTEKVKDYYRCDFQMSYTINKPGRSSVWKIDIQNVTNRENVFARYFDNHLQDIRTAYQGGIIPTLSYRIEF